MHEYDCFFDRGLLREDALVRPGFRPEVWFPAAAVVSVGSVFVHFAALYGLRQPASRALHVGAAADPFATAALSIVADQVAESDSSKLSTALLQ